VNQVQGVTSMGQREQAIFRSIASYIPRFMVEEQLLHSHLPAVHGQFYQGTLLLADISGFTTMSEELSKLGKEGAEELAAILNSYFTHMIDIAASYGGDQVKFGGDAMLLYFRGRRHAARAVRCSLMMLQAMKNFKQVSTSQGRFDLKMHIGINSGEFFAASLGSPDQQLHRIFTGREVNCTAQIEAVARSGEVLIGATTLQELGERVDIDEEREGHYRVRSLKARVRATPFPAYNPEGKEVEDLVGNLSLYLPQQVRERIMADPERQGIEGEHRRVTVMFINVVGCTEIIERHGVRGSKEITDIFNQYFLMVQNTVAKYKGLLLGCDLSIKGDKLLITFGAPKAHEDDDERAILCALEIQHQVSDSGLPLHQKIGINTGYVFSGEIGSTLSKEYTVMGDHVNLAARLMGVVDDGKVLIGYSTYSKVADKCVVRRYEPIMVKGKSQPVEVYEVTGLTKVKAPHRHLSTGKLVGREKEMDLLSGIMGKALSGQEQVVAIIGAAGIGKSRLVEELQQLWKRQGGQVHIGNCQSYGANVPYLPWIDLLNSFFDLQINDTPAQRQKKIETAMESLCPGLTDWTAIMGNLLGVSMPESNVLRNLDSSLRHQRLLNITVELIKARGEKIPALLVFEDLHWADGPSVELLNYVALNLKGCSTLVCASYRPEQGCRLGAEGQENYTSIVLEELSYESSLKLAQSIIKMDELPPQVTEFAVVRSQGNPFYIEEGIKALVDAGHLQQDLITGQYRMAKILSQTEVPDTIEGIIMSRLDGLEDESRNIVRVASVIGRVFEYDVLNGIYPRPIEDRELQQRLRDLVALDVIHVERSGSKPEYRFKHILTRDVAYESVLYAERRELHHKIGDYFEKTFGDYLEPYYELLSYHFGRTKDNAKALVYGFRAGDKAKRMYANKDAIEYYQKALESAAQIEDVAGIASKIHEELGDVHELGGEYDRAFECYQASVVCCNTFARSRKRQLLKQSSTDKCARLEDLPSIADKDRHRAILFAKSGMSFERRGQYHTALDWLDRGLHILGKTEGREIAQICIDKAGVLYRQGSHKLAMEWCQRGIQFARRVGNMVQVAHASYLQGNIHADMGNIQQAIDLRLESLRIYQSIDHLPGQAVVHNNLGVAFYYGGDWKTCRQHYEEGLALYTRIGDVQGMAMVSNNLGEVLSDQGEFNEAIKAFRRCLETWSGIGYSIGVVISQNNMGRAYTRQGQWQIAVDHLSQSINLIEKMETRGILAAEAYQRLAEAHLCAGHPRLALQLCEQSLSFAEQGQLAVVEGVTRRVMGQAYRCLEEWDDAEKSLILSGSILKERGVPHELASTRWESALLYSGMARAGVKHDLAGIAAVVDEAVSIFKELGIKYDMAKAAALRALADGAPTSLPPPLSP